MLKKDCQNCKYMISLIGIGLSIRCSKKENQEYKEKKYNEPVLIASIPDNCSFKEEK